MSFGEFIACGLLGLFAIYVAARLVTAAYFNSKQQHERRKPL